MVNINLIIFICTVAPISFMFLILKGKSRTLFLFLVIGMFICFFSGEISGLTMNLLNLDFSYFVVNGTPVIEEILKLFPIFIFVFLYSPDNQTIFECSITLGLGFALLENVFYLITSENASLTLALIRGFCSGPLHCFCTLIAGYGLTFIRLNKKLFVTGGFSLLTTTILIHAIYNLIIQSRFFIFGIFIPVILFFAFYFLIFKKQIIKEEKFL